ncbi:hypothetical protein PR202_gb06040 [Eleusine coracana subsp. coracana]|uniref:Uncharacterized protein n=1 Tax=Eleusine coracana subsp. coracana TaxID=191504 RepID=A0AAV5E8N2_ELECO|nr:hypothetical protein PR202_gb06040 [Eleusine coracana subsp. coracana]
MGVLVCLSCFICACLRKKWFQVDKDTGKAPKNLSFLVSSRLTSLNSFTFFQWIPELKHYAPGVPIILVGTKLDLRDDKQFFVDHPGAVPITTAQNVKGVFDAAIKVVLQPPKAKKKKKAQRGACSIL